MYRDPEVSSYYSDQFDAYKIIVHDIFLTMIALALEAERFDLIKVTLSKTYLVRPHNGEDRRATSDFMVFRQHVKSFESRNQRLKLNRLSLHADIFKEAHGVGSVPTFEALLQADFVLYMAGFRDGGGWYPITLVYATDRSSPFPLFARAESTTYLGRIAPIFGVLTADELKHRIAHVQDSQQTARLFQHHELYVSYLANLNHLGIVA